MTVQSESIGLSMFIEPPWGANLATLCDESIAVRPDRTALIDDNGERVPYRELGERIASAGNALEALGVRAGDRLALLFPNEPSFVYVLLGAIRLGALPMAVNVELKGKTLSSIIADSGATTVVTSARRDVAEDALEVAHTVESVETVAVSTGGRHVERSLAGGSGRSTRVESFDPLFEDAATRLDPAPVDGDDPCLILYTSGTSGRPKGVVISHRALGWNADTVRQLHFLDHRDSTLALTPFYHSNTMVGVLLPVLAAGGTVIVPPEFDAYEAIAAIESHGITYLRAVPAVFKMMVSATEALARHDVSSLSWAVAAGSPVPEELREQVRTAFDARLVSSYGSTETGTIAVTPRWGPRKPDRVGLPPPDVEVRLVDPEDDSPVEVGQTGELLVAGPGLGRYEDHPESEAFEWRDGQRFFRTGDLAHRDEWGYIEVVGRLDDLFNVGGRKVAPASVEERLLAHPAVSDAAVVPAPHAVKGEVPVAFVVAGDAVCESDLKTFALAQGPAYAHPRRVIRRDALPRSATGKLDRDVLQEEAQSSITGTREPSPSS